jgi:hypothetical protein
MRLGAAREHGGEDERGNRRAEEREQSANPRACAT